jgi:hypothetical protein
MSLLRSFLSGSVAGATLLLTTASAARADGRTLFVWTGTVDREAIIVMRGAYLETRGDGFEFDRQPRFRVTDALPRTRGVVRVERENGRGDVDVIEQPTEFNGYTARVRVRDRQSGADRYRLIVRWESARDSRDDDRYERDGRRDGDGRDDGDGRWGFGRRGDERDTRIGSGALHWSGKVDDVAEIQIQGRRVSFFSRSGRRLDDVRFDVSGAALPAASVPLDLRRFAGRGNVFIAEYPRVWNNWTAVIRIDDSRSGADGYEFDLRW